MENKKYTYDFTTVIDRNVSGDIKTNKAIVRNMLHVDYPDDAISMWVADMDFATPPQVQDAITKRVQQGILGYSMADSAYYDSIIDWYKRRHKMHIEKDWIVYSSGTLTALRNSIYTFTQKDEGIIIQPPVYFPFEGNITSTGRTVLRNELIYNADGTFAIDFEDFENKAKLPSTKMFILCNPHNPIGQIWSKEDVARMLEITQKYGVIVFSDEIHADLIRKESEFTSALSLPNSDLTIVATALNKTFNLAGLHLTNLVIKNNDLRNKLSAFTGWVGISPLAIEATKTALNDSEDWVEEVNDVIDENLDLVDKFVREKFPQIGFVRPEGTYLTWMDFNAFGMREGELLKVIANEARLILEGGSMFGKSARGFIRMNVALPTSMLKIALKNLGATLEKILERKAEREKNPIENKKVKIYALSNELAAANCCDSTQSNCGTDQSEQNSCCGSSSEEDTSSCITSCSDSSSDDCTTSCDPCSDDTSNSRTQSTIRDEVSDFVYDYPEVADFEFVLANELGLEELIQEVNKTLSENEQKLQVNSFTHSIVFPKILPMVTVNGKIIASGDFPTGDRLLSGIETEEPLPKQTGCC